MRTLNQPEVISALQNEFINCWLLAKDLDEIANQANDPDIEKLCQLIKDNYKYPVDTVLISKDLSVFGHINVHQSEVMMPNGYLSFLKEGLEKIGRQLDIEQNQESGNATELTKDPPGSIATKRKPPVGLKLTQEKPDGSLLEVVRNKGKVPGMAMYPIDVSDFANGGTIDINVRLGGGDAIAQCELCAPDSQNPNFFITLQSIPKITPGETKTIKHKFEKAQRLMLIVKTEPAPNDLSQSNAMLAEISVSNGK